MAKRRENVTDRLKVMIESLGAHNEEVAKIADACAKVGKQVKEAEVTKAEAAQEMSEVMTRAEGVHGLNKQAVKVLVKFSKLNDGKKADYLRTLLPGLVALLPKQLDLFAEAEPVDEESEAEPAEPGPPSGAPLQ